MLFFHARTQLRRWCLAIGCCAAAGAWAQGTVAPGAGIANTSHDPRLWSFGWETQICVMCHAPHNANSTVGVLWNHDVSAVASYTTYASNTKSATIGQPGALSKLCLSCHDGTVAIMAYGGAVGGMTMIDASGATARSVIGVDLSNDHPIGFTYDAALVAADTPTRLHAVTDAVTVGSTKTKSGNINSLLLFGGKLECPSCHDVHNKFTVANPDPNVAGQSLGLLRVTMAASKLCTTCHIK